MKSESVSQVPVLMFHEVADGSETRSPLAVTPAAFAAQLAYLHEMGWKTITAGELSAFIMDGTVPPARTIVLSFDDGYENFHSRVLPLLDKFGFTATLFMTSGWIREVRPPGPGIPRMLSWPQLSELAKSGIEIGAHTITHPQLDQLTSGRLRDELSGGKAQLEDKLGMEVPGLAYPFGYSTAAVRQAALQAGYAYAHAVGNRTATPDADPFAVPRLTVKRGTSMAEFSRLIGGEETITLRQDRILTGGWAVVRGARRAVRHVSGAHGNLQEISWTPGSPSWARTRQPR